MSNEANSKKPRKSHIDDDRAHQPLNTELMRRLWRYLAPYKRAVLGCLFVSMLVAGLKIAQPYLASQVIDQASKLSLSSAEGTNAELSGIFTLSAMFFGCIFFVLIFDVLFNYATAVVGQKSMHDLRLDIFRHVNRLDVSFFDRTPVGRLITRMTSDVATLNDLFSTGVIALTADLLMLAGLIVLMWTQNAQLTKVVLLSFPFMIVIIMLFRRHSRKWYLRARARLAQVNTYLQENVAGMATVQSFNRERRNYGQFRKWNDKYKQAQIQTIMGFAMFYPALNIILYVTLTTVIWFGGREIIESRLLGGETLEFATLFLFVYTVNMLFTPLRNLSEKYNLLQAAMASSARIFSLLDTPFIIKSEDSSATLTEFDDAIRFEHVDFDYIEGEPVLRDVSFEIKKGWTVAVVGATGSGKSTLVNLLTRFYDVKAGRISIDGTDIRQIELKSLRQLFAVVLQEVFLFSDTISRNLRLANPSLTDTEIWKILREVRAEDFVERLADGIDTHISERASTLSAGQKQLLSFARALAADPQVLILDEATANIDTETESRIQEAIGRMLEGRTAIVIAHRLSTIHKADMILVMHKGRVQVSGTHEELIARDGLYRRLYELQFSSSSEARTETASSSK